MNSPGQSASERDAFLRIFRASSPYIHAHRGRTLVLYLAGEALQQNDPALPHDLALLRSLGLRLVVVFGTRPQVNAAGLESDFHRHLRVTDREALAVVLQVAQTQLIRLQADLSNGLVNSPMHGAAVRTVTGNFVYARPRGIIDGVDLQYTGSVRRILVDDIRRQLDDDNIVLVPPYGFSVTGEVFNLSALEIAAACASGLRADKLVMLGPPNALPDPLENSSLSPRELEQHLSEMASDTPGIPEAETALAAIRAGVPRVHLLSMDEPGAVLRELYTRDGCGTMVSRDRYDSFRPARPDDIAGILELLRPLEESGALVRRSREQIERKIDEFVVNERDGAIIGCAALHPFPDPKGHRAELACVAVHPDYRSSSRGSHLLEQIERLAVHQGVTELFALTTQTMHWFLEHGFELATVDALPEARQELYNNQRNARVLIKSLT